MNPTGLGVLNAAMLIGLAGVAIPVVVHLLNRRNDPVIDWAAMRFLRFSPRERRRLNLAELVLMMARMGLMALVALALARPFWSGGMASTGAAVATEGGGGPRRDVVVILDGSARMGLRSGGATPRDRAIAWARGFLGRLGPGDSVAVLMAKDRVRAIVDPPTFDLDRARKAIAEAPAARGSGDLASALGEAFRILERTGNPAREVVILSDGRRSAWRGADLGRWALLRDLRRRLPVPPRIWAASFGSGGERDDGVGPDGSVGPIGLSRAVLTPGLPVEVSATIANAGPGPLTRPVELVVDGRVVAGSSRSVGPIPPGGQAPVSFRTAFERPGSHLVAVRLAPGGDPLPLDDESSRPVAVAPALGVLLVDGEPGLEPLGGEVDFLRAALAPTGDPSPLVRASTVASIAVKPADLSGMRVVVLANVDRVGREFGSALSAFVEAGGGLLVAPGDRVDLDAFNAKLAPDGKGWPSARLGPLKGDFHAREAVAHPAPGSFDGPALGPLAKGDPPALGEADLFAYRRLDPAPGATVSARLDTGDPWIVERPFGKGRVALLAGPVDAEGGTLPANPDFVPWAHELIAHLAAGANGPQPLKPGEPLVFDLDPPPPASVSSLPLTTPSGAIVPLPVVRSGPSARARHADTAEPGIYRLDAPGGPIYMAVVADARPDDPAPLEPIEAEALARGWPFAFEPDPARLPDRVLASDRARRSELWHPLILAALAGLCLEVWLTRRLALAQGS